MMEKELKMLLELIMQGSETDKRKMIDPDCIVFAQMRLEGDGIDVEVGTGKLTSEAFECEFGNAYTQALDRTVKQLGGVLRDFAYEIDRIGSREASEDAGKHNAGRRPL